MAARPRIYALVFAALTFSATAQAQERPSTAQEAPEEGTLIAYVDDQGQLHVVNSLEMVPQQYRSRARPAKLGESSTLSSDSKTRRSSPRRDRSRRAPPRAGEGAAASGQSSAERSRGKKDKDRQQERKALAELQKQRERVLEDLVLLEEGWLPEDGKDKAAQNKPEPTTEELEMRTESLTKQLQELDRQITNLKAKEQR